MTTEQGYRAPQVCKLVGITYRQLDYWARTNLIRPSLRRASGSGSHRLYAFSDVVQLKVIKRLLDAGMSLKKIRSAVEILREQMDSDRPVQDEVEGAIHQLFPDEEEPAGAVKAGAP